jgi:hypothetical protein
VVNARTSPYRRRADFAAFTAVVVGVRTISRRGRSGVPVILFSSSVMLTVDEMRME